MSWAPTIALSLLWGLGFFYCFQITLTNGWLGFIAFAFPSVLGLFTFGWVMGDPRRDAAAILTRLQARYTGLFLCCQVFGVAITIFAAAAYLFIPLFGRGSILLVAIFVLLTTAIGHAASMRGLKAIHAGYLVVGLAAVAVLLVGLLRLAPPHPIVFAAFDGRFYGLVLPTVAGLMLGPWTNIQHWQRVVLIQTEGGSIRGAYACGALLFLCLMGLNALVAIAAGPALVITTSDGLKGMQAAVAGAVSGTGSHVLIAAYLGWAAVAIASTLDSFYYATRWLLRKTAAGSNSPLMAFVPPGILTSPLWFLLSALLVALLMINANVAMVYLMMPFSSLLVGAALCVVCESIGAPPRYDATLCAMIGTAAFLMLLTGYIGDIPAMMELAPLVAVVGALPAIQGVFARRTAKAAPAPAGGTAVASELASEIHTVHIEPDEAVLGHGYDGQWYYMHLVPTYDDTNSVGNVYFANYFRWIGKTRELLFNSCMPEFDLKTTSFYVLTKSFEHDFRREIREFTPVTVRLKIGSYNRKFVTLVHEIHSRTDGLIGKGEQTIMFVDSVHYKPLDIPPVILRSFMPYFAQAARLNAGGKPPGAPMGEPGLVRRG